MTYGELRTIMIEHLEKQIKQNQNSAEACTESGEASMYFEGNADQAKAILRLFRSLHVEEVQ